MSARRAVLYCTCCDTLSPVLPAAALEQKLAGSPALFLTATRLCARDEALARMQTLRDAGVSACVVAGCSFLARGAQALRHLSSAPSATAFEWVDIREGCAWIHAGQPEQALAKAVDAVRMGFAALDHRPAPEPEGDAPTAGLRDPVLIVGAGPAGLAAAAVLADAGLPVVLAERHAAPGGMLRQLGPLFPDLSPASALIARLDERAGTGVDRRFGCAVTRLDATERGYRALLSRAGATEEVHASALILATGALPVLPVGHLRYREAAGVSSQMELEVLLGKVESGRAPLSALPKRAVFVQCVAARSATHPYCSAICCPTALKNALRLKMLDAEAQVTLAHRNIVTPGIALEAFYRRATAAGVRLRSFAPESTPEVLGGDRVEGVRILDALSGAAEDLPADMLVCSTPLKPAPDTASLARGLGLRLDEMGFLCGKEPLQPLEAAIPGVFVCGSARWPVSAAQAVEQGSAAAMKALHHVRNSGRVAASGAWSGELRPSARVRAEACSRCGRCTAACPYGACVLPESGPMRVWELRCRRCGVCAAICPGGAATLPGNSFAAMRARIREARGGTPT